MNTASDEIENLYQLMDQITNSLENIRHILSRALVQKHPGPTDPSTTMKYVAAHDTFDRALEDTSISDATLVTDEDLSAGIPRAITEKNERKWEKLETRMPDIPFTYKILFPLDAALDTNEVHGEIVEEVKERKKRSGTLQLAPEEDVKKPLMDIPFIKKI